jgi:protein-S-isoprenylcysteine O-methyltransferase Ste14
MLRLLLKGVLHNLGVSAVSAAVALGGVGIDHLVHLTRWRYAGVRFAGSGAFLIGLLLRVWATVFFYERQMRIIALSPQGHLIDTGPYRYSRNPLYLGGNVFMFLGASLSLGSPGGVLLTVLHLPLVEFMIRREERQLEQTFGDEWRRYKRRVRRWV